MALQLQLQNEMQKAKILQLQLQMENARAAGPGHQPMQPPGLQQQMPMQPPASSTSMPMWDPTAQCFVPQGPQQGAPDDSGPWGGYAHPLQTPGGAPSDPGGGVAQLDGGWGLTRWQ